MEAIATVTYEQGLIGKIMFDHDSPNPRHDDQLGTMTCWHSLYRLGDDNPWPRRPISRAIDQHFIMLPLYLYDHSVLAIRTVTFSCPWDSGQVGWIYVPIAQVKKEFGWQRLTRARRRKIEHYLRGEVEQYDQYLSGQVIEFILEDHDEQFLDACGGFYDEQDCRQMLQAAAESQLSHRPPHHELQQ